MALRPANYMPFIQKGTGNFQATELKSMDQKFLQQTLAEKDRHRAFMTGGPMEPSPSLSAEEWNERMALLQASGKRGQRGGMTFDPKQYHY